MYAYERASVWAADSSGSGHARRHGSGRVARGEDRRAVPAVGGWRAGRREGGDGARRHAGCMRTSVWRAPGRPSANPGQTHVAPPATSAQSGDVRCGPCLRVPRGRARCLDKMDASVGGSVDVRRLVERDVSVQRSAAIMGGEADVSGGCGGARNKVGDVSVILPVGVTLDWGRRGGVAALGLRKKDR